MRMYPTTCWQISFHFRKDLCPIRSPCFCLTNRKIVRALLTSLITLLIVSYKMIVASTDLSVIDPSTAFSTSDIDQLVNVRRLFLSPIYKRLLNFATSVLFEWKYMKRLFFLTADKDMKVKMILKRCVRSSQRSGFDSRTSLNFFRF